MAGGEDVFGEVCCHRRVGLDETEPNMTRQEVAFKRLVQLAHQLGKPLVLHLRGQNAIRTSAIYSACYHNKHPEEAASSISPQLQ